MPLSEKALLVVAMTPPHETRAAVYLAAETGPADDISRYLRLAADALEAAEARVRELQGRGNPDGALD